MNRKLVSEQKNDISLIIGNLPKRLQKKIADETGAECYFANEQEARNVECHVDAKIVEGDCYPLDSQNIDVFCGLNETPTRAAYADLSAGNEARSTETAAIPGILRLGSVSKTEARVRGEGAAKRGRAQNSGYSAVKAQMSTGRHAKRACPAWFKQVPHKDNYTTLLPELHYQLLDIMEQNLNDEKLWTTFCNCHYRLRDVFAQLLVDQLKFCCEQKVETYFWKLLFYNVIERMKHEICANANTHTIFIINIGLSFYSDLLDKLNEKYISHNEERTRHRFHLIATVSSQKLLICLGDLSRYKSKLLHLSDFSAASCYYQRAQKLIPSNGIPYNQLAVLAIYNRNKFDAVYYHMRSLMASNAIYSARESLHVLFDEIRKKHEDTESPVHSNKARFLERKPQSLRKEVWIHPDGVRSVHRTDVNETASSVTEETSLGELSTDELLRRFLSLYLYVIGKLFTGIGLETIQDQQRRLLIQLRYILKYDTLIISTNRLLKIVALNIFIMEHNKSKETRREVRYHGFVFCNEIFGLLLHKCNELFGAYVEEHTLKPTFEKSFNDMNNLLKYLNVWCVWLSKNVHIWEPVRSEWLSVIDPWAELPFLLDNIESILDKKHIKGNAYVGITLEEDTFMLGFTPINKTCSTLIYDNKVDNHEVQFYARLAKIAKFKLCFKQHQNRLKSKTELNFSWDDMSTENKHASTNALNLDNNDENIVDNGVLQQQKQRPKGSPVQVNINILNAPNSQASQLSKLKRELEAKTNINKMYTEKFEEILKFVDTNLYIEVRPKYLLPDTNCFIDCLEDLEKLVREHRRYILIIPLTVVKELDGLSKGVKIESYKKSLQQNRIHHFDDVSTRAKKSLEFIRTTNNNVKCATTKGSVINASLFGLVDEEPVSNDDKILATALALSKTLSMETTKDGKCVIQTELVLITMDRNLRVKALSRNLAVSELSEFQQWANNEQRS